jgi:hypothetical protein
MREDEWICVWVFRLLVNEVNVETVYIYSVVMEFVEFGFFFSPIIRVLPVLYELFHVVKICAIIPIL